MAFVMGTAATEGDPDRMPDYPVFHAWYDDMMRNDPCRPLAPWMTEYFPTNLIVDAERHGALTSWLMFRYYGIPPRTKEIIERLEPGVHQFLPLRVVYRIRGVETVHQFYTLKINRCAELYDLSRMKFSSTTLRPGLVVHNLEVGHPVVFQRSAIAGVHLWRQQKVKAAHLMSQELKEALEREALLDGLELTPCELV